MSSNTEKLEYYAMATEADIGCNKHDLVIDGRVDRCYGGTVFDQFVATEKGHRFSTKGEAINNARLFVKQCHDALKVAESGGEF